MPIIPQIFEHEQFGKVRVIGDSENPKFCLSDVCKVLAIGNPSQAKTRLDDGVISNEVIPDSMGRMQTATFVNEDGLYDLVLDSRKPEAKKFRKWITSDVVPSIRKHGFYIAPQAELDIKAIINPNFLRRMADELESRDKQIAELTGQVKDLKPKADYCEKILQSTEALPVTVIAKDYGMGAVQFNELLHKLEIQYKVGKTWVLYQIYAGLGYMKSVTTKLANGLSVTQTRWTQKGRMFLYSILKKAGVLPIIERESPMATII